MDKINELKIRAYDLIAMSQQIQNELSQVNQAIAEEIKKLNESKQETK